MSEEDLSELSTDVSSVDTYDGCYEDMNQLLALKQEQINILLEAYNRTDMTVEEKDRVQEQLDGLEVRVGEVERDIGHRVAK